MLILKGPQRIGVIPSDAAGSRNAEAGQAALSIVLILGLFLLAAMGFAVDVANIFFHRQAAGTAAAAACQAGAMDLLEGTAVSSGSGKGFTAGTASDCVTNSSATMCTYAAANGYSGAGLVDGTASDSVSWTFPASIPGVVSAGTNSMLKIVINENIRTYFMSLATGAKFQTIHVSSSCGAVPVKGSAPMVVLHPSMSGALSNSGAGLYIAGGPQRGLQVNSTSSTAIMGSALVDTSKGGPQQSGSDVAVVGGPGASPAGSCSSTSGFCGGTSGFWRSDVVPVPDPFGRVGPPTIPAAASPSIAVSYGVNGCPDHRGCTEYFPGYYSSGIKLSGSTTTAIFDPGLYYMNGSLSSTATGTLRNAKPAGVKATDGVLFYFAAGSLNLAGSTGVADTVDIDNVKATDLTCDGNLPLSALNMPSSLAGNVLIGPCTRDGTYWDSAGDTIDTAGTPGVRGLLMFQATSNTAQAVMTGSGSLAFAGALYFHSSGYADVLKFSGNGSSTTFVIGEIVADQIVFSGNGAVALALNPASTINTLKAALLE